MRIFTIIGARPQFIKAAIVSKSIANTLSLTEELVHTGQHYDENMSGVFFEEMGIPEPSHHLRIAGGSHGAMTGQMLIALEDLLFTEKPDLVMIYGDTNSTIAGALAAAKLHIPLAHVESGLRSFNKRMPEEINRIVADHCSDLLFTPTAVASDNLVREGVPRSRIIETGDVMFDAAIHFGKEARARGVGPQKHEVEQGNYVLATVHRQENTDCPARLSAIFEGLARVATQIPVVLPLHPRTRNQIKNANLGNKLGAIKIIDPVGYLEMVGLEGGASVVATDSGGVQKEAYFHQKPCVTFREETEWTELVDSGWNTLVDPANPEAIFNSIMQSKGKRGKNVSLYGAGDAVERIVSALERFAA